MVLLLLGVALTNIKLAAAISIIAAIPFQFRRRCCCYCQSVKRQFLLNLFCMFEEQLRGREGKRGKKNWKNIIKIIKL
jgi:hypothetical protein